MAVVSVVRMEVRWERVGDLFFMQLYSRDGLAFACDMAGSLWRPHGLQVRKAMDEREASVARVIELPGAKGKRPKH